MLKAIRAPEEVNVKSLAFCPLGKSCMRVFSLQCNVSQQNSSQASLADIMTPLVLKWMASFHLSLIQRICTLSPRTFLINFTGRDVNCADPSARAMSVRALLVLSTAIASEHTFNFLCGQRTTLDEGAASPQATE